MDYDAKNRVILLDSNKSGLENPQGIGFYQQQLFWIDATADGGTLNRVSTENRYLHSASNFGFKIIGLLNECRERSFFELSLVLVYIQLLFVDELYLNLIVNRL